MDKSQNIASSEYDSFFDDNFVDPNIGKICKIKAFSLCYQDSRDDIDLDDPFIPAQEIVGMIMKTEGIFQQVLSLNNSQKIWTDSVEVDILKTEEA